MTSKQPPLREEEGAPKRLHNTLSNTFSTTLKQHLQRCLLGLPFVLLFHHQTSHLRPFLRLLSTIIATWYYSFLCLMTSVLLSPLLYLHHQTNTLKALLCNLLDTLISPLRHIKSPTLRNVSDTMSEKSNQVLKTEAKRGRRIVVWLLITVVKKVVEIRFGEMFDDGKLTAETLSRIAGRELIGLVLGPVHKTAITCIVGVVVGAALFGIAPFVLLRVLVR